MSLVLEDVNDNNWQVSITTQGALTTTQVGVVAIPVGQNNLGPVYATTNTSSGQNGFSSALVYSPNNSIPILDPRPRGPGG